MDVNNFWKVVLAQDRGKLESYFLKDASIKWHCTNECFTVDEYIKANCDYPGDWDGEIERIENLGDTIISAVRVFPKDKSMSFHVVSFISLRDGKIQSMDEYWSDDTDVPLWRQKLNIGKPIR